MCCPSCSITFWATECNTPNVFCLASYSTILLVSGFRPTINDWIATLPFLAKSDFMTTY
jgi:hypothetical protein